MKVTCGANASVTQGGCKKATYQPQANVALHSHFGAPRRCGYDQERSCVTAPSGRAAILRQPFALPCNYLSYHGSQRLSACCVDWSMPLLQIDAIARWPFAQPNCLSSGRVAAEFGTYSLILISLSCIAGVWRKATLLQAMTDIAHSRYLTCQC